MSVEKEAVSGREASAVNHELRGKEDSSNSTPIEEGQEEPGHRSLEVSSTA